MNPSMDVALKSIVGAYSVIFAGIFVFRMADVRPAEKAGEEAGAASGGPAGSRAARRAGCTCRRKYNCPPESGGQHDRDSSRDRAGGGSRAALFRLGTTPRVIAKNAMTLPS